MGAKMTVALHDSGNRMIQVMKRPVIALVLLALVGAGLLWHFARAPRAAGKTEVTSAPIPVIVANVSRKDVPIYLMGLGTVQASNTVTVTAQVEGVLEKVTFVEGQDVKKGQLLAQIDPRPYQAQLEQAIAKKAVDEAQLEHARRDLERYAKLAPLDYTSKLTFDATTAQVAQLVAQLKGDQGSIDYAKTQLDYTSITSPLDGRTGVRLIDAGNIVRAANAMVVVTQLQPISVFFTLATTDIQQVQDALQKGPLVAAAFSQDDKTKLDTGTLLLVDNQADPTSGTVRLKASFPNKQQRLWPGTFVNVELVTAIQHDGLTIPLDAIQQGPQGQYVFLVGTDRKVAMRPVSIRQSLHGEALIDQGLSVGEVVVVRGQYRLLPDSLVSLADPRDPNVVPNPSTASSGMLP
jgi:multidrug efflux system membrane fusion protein